MNAEDITKSDREIEEEIADLLSKFSLSEESLSEIKRRPLKSQRNILKLMYDEECRRAQTQKVKRDLPLS